jgi:hypothetical protein
MEKIKGRLSFTIGGTACDIYCRPRRNDKSTKVRDRLQGLGVDRRILTQIFLKILRVILDRIPLAPNGAY